MSQKYTYDHSVASTYTQGLIVFRIIVLFKAYGMSYNDIYCVTGFAVESEAQTNGLFRTIITLVCIDTTVIDVPLSRTAFTAASVPREL